MPCDQCGTSWDVHISHGAAIILDKFPAEDDGSVLDHFNDPSEGGRTARGGYPES